MAELDIAPAIDFDLRETDTLNRDEHAALGTPRGHRGDLWSGLIGFFALRYGLKRPDVSRPVLVLVVAEHIALLAFGVVDFVRTGTWSLYETAIAGVLTYMLIWGRKDLDRLDGWVGRRVQRWQSRHD